MYHESLNEAGGYSHWKRLVASPQERISGWREPERVVTVVVLLEGLEIAEDEMVLDHSSGANTDDEERS